MAKGIQNRGFATLAKLHPDRQREISSRGGKAAHEKGTAHEFTSEEARKAGRKGGLKKPKQLEQDSHPIV